MSIDGVRCVVFDLDDTLFLERDYVRSGFFAVGRWMLDQRGVEGFGERCWTEFDHGTRGDVFDHVLDQLGVATDPGLVPRLVEVYRSHEPTVRMLPDAAAALSDLEGRVALAAVTDGPLASQQAKARAVGAVGRLDPIVYTAELDVTKPDMRAFTPVEAARGVRGAECVYVADNPHKDFIGPRRLGWGTIRVRRRQSLHAAVDSGDAVDLELGNLATLAADLATCRPTS
jgi:putative hydrolase of the HAD superfamily